MQKDAAFVIRVSFVFLTYLSYVAHEFHRYQKRRLEGVLMAELPVRFICVFESLLLSAGPKSNGERPDLANVLTPSTKGPAVVGAGRRGELWGLRGPGLGERTCGCR